MIEFNTRECRPWTDISLALNNMRTLKVKVGKKVFEGAVVLHNDDGDITIEFVTERKASTSKKSGLSGYTVAA